MRTIDLQHLPVEIQNHLHRYADEPLQICVLGKPTAVLLPYTVEATKQPQVNFYDALMAWRQTAKLDPNDDFEDVFEGLRR